MRRALITGAAVLALSFGAAACGSSDDSGDGSSSEDTLTKTELIEKADALCVKFDGEVATSFENADLTPESTKADFSAFVTDEIVPLYRDQIEQLRELTPDEESADDYNNIVDTLESELDAVEEDPTIALGDDTPFKGATAAAQDFGLKDCGSQ